MIGFAGEGEVLRYTLPPTGWGPCLEALDPTGHRADGEADHVWQKAAWTRVLSEGPE